MRKFVFRLVCLAALPVFLLVTAGAAQQRPATPDRKVIPLNIAVVDMDSIGEKATAVKGLRRQMASYRQKFQSQIQKEEQELRNADQELARKRAILSPEAFNAERQKFVAKVQTLGRKVDGLKRELARSESTAMLEVKKALSTIIADVAKELKLAIILRRQTTVLVSNSLDITAIVLARFDKAMPSVKVPEPNPQAASRKPTPGKPPLTPGKK